MARKLTSVMWALGALVVALIASGCQPSQESLEISDTRFGATNVTYDFFATYNGDVDPVLCTIIQFSLNADGTGGPPPGMDVSSAARVTTPPFEYNDVDLLQSGVVMANNNATGTVKVTSTGNTQTKPTGRIHFRIGGITNGSIKNQTYYATGNFYTNSGCTTKGNDSTYVIPFNFTDTPVKEKPALRAQVLPAMSLSIGNFISSCNTTSAPASNFRFAGGSYKNLAFGRVVPDSPVYTGQAVSFESNSKNGAVVFLRGTDLTGSRTITRMPGTTAAPAEFTGSEGYGFHVPAFAEKTWAGIPTSNFQIHSTNYSGSSTSLCALYQVRIDATTPFETYNGELIYTLVPRF